MRVIDLIRRLRDEFTAMPGLRLTPAQVGRLCGTTASRSASALHALVSAGFLGPMADGSFARTEVVTTAGGPLLRGRSRRLPSPWRRILCLIEPQAGPSGAMSPASRAALHYAVTLAVTHRARITALQVVPHPSSEQTLTSTAEELGKTMAGEPFRALIDVHVATGAPTQAIADAAKYIGADLIVVGRSEATDAESSHPLMEAVRGASCPVLIVHPSGRAAVA